MPEPIDRHCRTCGALPGEPCQSQSRHRPEVFTHAARRDGGAYGDRCQSCGAEIVPCGAGLACIHVLLLVCRGCIAELY